MITIDDVRENETVKIFIKRTDMHLEAIGYTEHGFRHMTLVSVNAGMILTELGFSEREIEMAKIAGYLHDIGNLINRLDHPHSSAILAKDILKDMGMSMDEIAIIMGAIGNHDESFGGEPVNPVAAALIVADKADVHRSRVRSTDQLQFDIHDRVNYAVEESSLEIDNKERTLSLSLKVDTRISQVMEYFEIFLSRMLISKKAARYLGCKFKLIINDYSLL